ncbi:MAG: hypothetical protein L6R42_008134 [Xanthoria sp. 1 TBL-2021]|nr:MAG: hypothetical protein L6R42_008134 [Xanthoria sp. 1 TBL-2021]
MFTWSITTGLALLLTTLIPTVTALPLPSPDLVPYGIEPKPVTSVGYTIAEHNHDFPPRSKRTINPILEPHIPLVSKYPPSTPDNAPPSMSGKGGPPTKRTINPILEPHIPLVSTYPPSTPDNAPRSMSGKRDPPTIGKNAESPPAWNGGKTNPWDMGNYGGSVPRLYDNLPASASFPLATGPGLDSPPKTKRDLENDSVAANNNEDDKPAPYHTVYSPKPRPQCYFRWFWCPPRSLQKRQPGHSPPDINGCPWWKACKPRHPPLRARLLSPVAGLREPIRPYGPVSPPKGELLTRPVDFPHGAVGLPVNPMHDPPVEGGP